MTNPFGIRLQAAMAERGPLCVGIDPHPALLTQWGLSVDAAGLERFAMTVIEALADRVAVLKPQSALFEVFGSSGIAVLERVLAAGSDAGALMLLDAKRGDIGSTMAAYAAAYLTDGAPLAADALTVSPFLGFGSLQPAIDAALGSGRGLFVLCRTSNPDGEGVQLAQSGEGATLAQAMADSAAAVNAQSPGLGSIGLVVGATVTTAGADFSQFNGPFLVPGLGAQGGEAADLRRIFGRGLGGVLPTASRSILRAGPSVGGLRSAATQTIDEVRAAVA